MRAPHRGAFDTPAGQETWLDARNPAGSHLLGTLIDVEKLAGVRPLGELAGVEKLARFQKSGNLAEFKKLVGAGKPENWLQPENWLHSKIERKIGEISAGNDREIGRKRFGMLREPIRRHSECGGQIPAFRPNPTRKSLGCTRRPAQVRSTCARHLATHGRSSTMATQGVMGAPGGRRWAGGAMRSRSATGRPRAPGDAARDDRGMERRRSLR